MNRDATGLAFVDEIVGSSDPEVRRLVASGLAPLPLPELLSAQVYLTHEDDKELAATARASLDELDPKIVVSVLREEPPDNVVGYFARPDQHPVIVEAILRLRRVSRPLLAKMALALETDMQELLLLRQDAIVEHPEILDRLEENPRISSYAARRIAEYREHLLPRHRFEEEEVATGIDDWKEDVDEALVESIRSDFQAVEDGKSEDELENIWKASEIKIRSLPVAVRMRLARGATALMRRILIRDQNSMVALAIVTTSPITEAEVERICLSRIVVDEVLAHIAASKKWARRYKVSHALCQNPRTPINVSIRMLPRLSAKDLQKLSRNRNVAEAVRARALRLYRIKIQ